MTVILVTVLHDYTRPQLHTKWTITLPGNLQSLQVTMLCLIHQFKTCHNTSHHKIHSSGHIKISLFAENQQLLTLKSPN